MPESNRIEYKREITDELEKEFVAFTENFLRMTFPAIENVYADEKSGSIGGQIGGQIGEIDELTERQKEIVILIAEDRTISRAKIARRLNINTSAVQWHLELLKKKGILKRIGSTRGYWKIITINKSKSK